MTVELFGAVELLANQFSIPAQDRVRFGDAGAFSERFAPQALSNLSKLHCARRLQDVGPCSAGNGSTAQHSSVAMSPEGQGFERCWNLSKFKIARRIAL